MNLHANRLVVVSNRLPVTIGEGKDGSKVFYPASGGLVTAMAPILARNKGLWIGWPGAGDVDEIERLTNEFNQGDHFKIYSIPLTPEEEEKYYRGFANKSIWPLFHDQLGLARFVHEQWEMYERVNRRFAEAVAAQIQPDDIVWIHDYQLMRVAHHLREMGIRHPLAYFHHIPFPSYDLYRRLPWRRETLDGLIDYDLLGFQTLHDRRNFIWTLRAMKPGARVNSHRRHSSVILGGREIRVGNYPISIDFSEFNNMAKTPEVEQEARKIKEAYGIDHLVLGLDRLDYTKGIPHRFLAFENLLEDHPELRGRVSLIQVVVPSRTRVKQYRQLKEELDQLTGRINARFGSHGYVPIHYYFKHLSRVELIAHYRACDVALITPLRDGMNLVAKEYVASRVDLGGALVLSEFTGSAHQLNKGAFIENPYDLHGTAVALWRALTLDGGERNRRMRLMRAQVRQNNVHRWVQWFVESLGDVKRQDGER